jgi:hypothetical protein
MQPLGVLPRQAARHELGDALAGRQVRILRQVGGAGAGLQEGFAGIERLLAGQGFQQGRLAARVAADQTGLVAAAQRYVKALEERSPAEAERGVPQGGKGTGRGHDPSTYFQNRVVRDGLAKFSG